MFCVRFRISVVCRTIFSPAPMNGYVPNSSFRFAAPAKRFFRSNGTLPRSALILVKVVRFVNDFSFWTFVPARSSDSFSATQDALRLDFTTVSLCLNTCTLYLNLVQYFFRLSNITGGATLAKTGYRCYRVSPPVTHRRSCGRPNR